MDSPVPLQRGCKGREMIAQKKSFRGEGILLSIQG
tara:strand:- start:17834 stop:17938 length:105 start_codon:yes stop_codon:yes gene_type:complete